MRITKIKLKNIGPYIGENNVFNLDTSKDKNIILIGGKNGAGKTTLLNSIKTGLFGAYAYGLKTNGNNYYDALRKLFNYGEAEKEKSYYAIEIEFVLIENYIENKYCFSRKWEKSGDNIIETFEVMQNGENLRNEKIEQIQEKLKETMPPSVIETVLFDGEKIAKIVDGKELSEYLKEIINVNFNLNIFEKMEDDINFYIEKEKDKESFNTDEINILAYKNKYTENQKNLKNLNDIYNKYLKTEAEYKFKLKNLTKKFENYGGINDEEKDIMKTSLAKLENDRKESIATIKEFLEDDIVFYLNYKRILNIKKAIEQEKPIQLLEYANEIEAFLGKEYVSKIKNELNNMIKNSEQNKKYNSTPKLDKLINHIIEKVEKTSIEKWKEILKNSRINFDSSKEYKKILGNNENDNAIELQKLLKEIKDVSNAIEEITAKIKETEKEIKKAESDVKTSFIEWETLEKKINSGKKEKNSFNIARKILQVSQKYKEQQIEIYLSKIEEMAVKKFEEINKKNKYITKIEIDRETFKITLYDNRNLKKDITILSAGEKQLLVSAIIWSVFKLADRNNMFIFDTPLARLDKENRELFVRKILCTISDQVWILSTDQEIVGNLYDIIENRINNKYKLINDENTGKTQIEEEYFE